MRQRPLQLACQQGIYLKCPIHSSGYWYFPIFQEWWFKFNMLPLLQKLDKLQQQHDDSSDIGSTQSEWSTPKETNETFSSGKIWKLMTPVTKMKVKRWAEISGKTEVKTTLQRELNMQIDWNANEPDFNGSLWKVKFMNLCYKTIYQLKH